MALRQYPQEIVYNTRDMVQIYDLQKQRCGPPGMLVNVVALPTIWQAAGGWNKSHVTDAARSSSA